MAHTQRTSAAVGRRQLLAGTGALAGLQVLAGCGLGDSEPGSEGKPDENRKPKAKEAPQLAQLVEAGELPPLEKRLPNNPMVLEPVEKVGEYGGTWQGGGVVSLFRRWVRYEGLVRWVRQTRGFTVDEIIPNVAEKFEESDSGRTYTFTLREGMKWSDGEPFTADDIMFWYEDVFSHEELAALRPSWLLASGTPVVEKADERTVVFRLEEPDGLFLLYMASPNGLEIVNYPRHYMEQFHPDYNADAEQAATDAGFEDWIGNFVAKAAFVDNKEKPTLHAWVMETPASEATDLIVAVRNPYYWKTDPDGRQLPYLDRVDFRLPSDPEAEKLWALNGEYDVYFGPAWTGIEPRDQPVFARNREKSGFHFQEIIPSFSQSVAIQLNLAHQDQEIREIFQSKDFRVGLSHAINRQEVIDTVFQRQGEPWQAAPRPESPFHDEELATQYTEYSVETANQHLDRILPDKDGDGRRLRPNGEPVSFGIDVTTSHTEAADAMELVRDYWAEVGIEMKVNAVEVSFFQTRAEANEHEGRAAPGIGGLEILTSVNWNQPPAKLWQDWYASGGERGEEPPEPVHEVMELSDQIRATVDRQQQIDLMHQILDIFKEQFWTMGISLWAAAVLPVRNDFHNVQDPMLSSFFWPSPGPSDPPQYWKEQA